MSAAEPFRWAILGTGGVAHKFALGLRAAATPMAVATVASRNPGNARRFASEHDGAVATESYAEAVRDNVDAVYIATPPSHHEEHALLAIAAGKPVLVEKPLAADLASATRIRDAARSAGVFCMEAMWTRFLPLVTVVRDRIRAGDLGEVRSFHGSFFGATAVGSSSHFDPERGGGALLHRGVYPLSLAVDLLGPVTRSQAEVRVGDTGVDEECALILHHASGALSTVNASLRVDGDSSATVRGTDGTTHIHPPIYRPSRATYTRTSPRQEGRAPAGGRVAARKEGALLQALNQRVGWLAELRGTRGDRVAFAGNGYHYQAEAVRESVLSGQLENPVMPLSDSLAVMAIIDQALAGGPHGRAT